MNKSNDQYIEHEVQLRIHTLQFKRIDNDIKGIKTLLISILGIGVTSLILPILLHTYKLT
jgi:hypothetical protein